MDLRQLLNQNGITREIELEMPTLPKTFEKELAQMYLEAVRVWSTDVVESLMAEYADGIRILDSAEGAQTILERVDQAMVQVLVIFRRDWMGWFNRARRNHYNTLVSRLKYATNVDLSTTLGASVQQETIDTLLERNVNLVRNVSADTRERISQAVFNGLQNRTSARTVAREISKATGLSRKRALRVASDQTVKLSSALDAERMKQLEVKGYIWQHSGKMHYRPEHKARNGKYIRFGSKIDREDSPGQAPFCGCKRRMKV